MSRKWNNMDVNHKHYGQVLDDLVTISPEEAKENTRIMREILQEWKEREEKERAEFRNRILSHNI